MYVRKSDNKFILTGNGKFRKYIALIDLMDNLYYNIKCFSKHALERHGQTYHRAVTGPLWTHICMFLLCILQELYLALNSKNAELVINLWISKDHSLTTICDNQYLLAEWLENERWILFINILKLDLSLNRFIPKRTLSKNE